MKKYFIGITQSFLVLMLLFVLSGAQSAVAAEGNIDATYKYAWSENSGWENFRPTHGGVTVHDTYLSGYAWAENIGWVKLGDGTGPYNNDTADNWGVNRDGSGALSGYAWSENVGWINFNPSHSQVTIDTATLKLDGYAWAENAGWVHFRNVSPEYYVMQETNVPTVTTQAVSAIGSTTATGNGNITDLGNPNPTAHGVCWNTGGTPTIGDSHTDEGAASATGAFTSSMTGLTAGATYYVRAYATNSAGTAYGSDVTFTTTCTYSISPTSKFFGSSGGTGTVDVTTQSGCSWTAASNETWITVTSGNSGTGSRTVSYSVSSNGNTSSRTGTMTIAGKTFTVTQAGGYSPPSCYYSISPASKSFGSSGGTGSVDVTSGCSWTAASNETWITVTSGNSGTGSRTVSYSVSSNGNTSSRTGTMTIAGKTFTVTQDGIIPAEVHHFTFDTISTQTAGTAFDVTITAQDENNNTVTSFEGTVDITSTGNLLAGGGTTDAFSSGVLTLQVIIGNTTTANPGTFTITATRTGGTETGTSNSFSVNPGVLNNFLIEAENGGDIGAQTAGTPFNIKITARDANMNTVTDFEETVDITSTGILSAGSGTTANFTDGILSSHTVTISNTGTFTIKATRTGETEEGTSNAFDVNPEPDIISPVIFGVLVASTTNSTAIITWNTDEPSTSKVEYGLSSSLGMSKEDTTLTTKHRVILTGLSASTKYYYRANSTDSSGNSGTSNTYTFTTQATPDITAPVITNGPLVDSYTVTDTSAIVFWSTDEPSTSVVEITIKGERKTFSDSSLVTRHRVTITGLSASTTYTYRVSSTDSSGNGPHTSKTDKNPSDDATFATRAAPDTTAPLIIIGPEVTYVSDHRALVTWVTNEPSTSRVDFGVSSTDERNVVDNTLVINHIMTLTNLIKGTTYVYKVISTDKSGNTVDPEYNFTTTETPDTAWPEITYGPEVTYKSETSAIIEWTTDEPGNSVVEFGKTIALGSMLSDSTFVTAHSIRLTNLTPGTEYHYKASSTDPSGNGPTESGTLSFITESTSDTTAPIITELSATTDGNTATITWKTDEPADSLVTYHSDNEFTKGDDEYVKDHSITLTNLDPGTYDYEASSKDPAGNSDSEKGSFLHCYPANPAEPMEGIVLNPDGPFINPSDTPVDVSPGIVCIAPQMKVSNCNNVATPLMYVYLPDYNVGVDLSQSVIEVCSNGIITFDIGGIDLSDYPGLVFDVYYGYLDWSDNIIYNAYEVTVTDLHCYPANPAEPMEGIVLNPDGPFINPSDTPVDVSPGIVCIAPQMKVSNCNNVATPFMYVYLPDYNVGVDLSQSVIEVCSNGIITFDIGGIDLSDYPGLVFDVYYGYLDWSDNIIYNAYEVTVTDVP